MSRLTRSQAKLILTATLSWVTVAATSAVPSVLFLHWDVARSYLGLITIWNQFVTPLFWDWSFVAWEETDSTDLKSADFRHYCTPGRMEAHRHCGFQFVIDPGEEGGFAMGYRFWQHCSLLPLWPSVVGGTLMSTTLFPGDSSWADRSAICFCETMR